MIETDPAKIQEARRRVLTELTKGGLTLSELTRGPLRKTPYERVGEAGAFMHAMVLDGLVRRERLRRGFTQKIAVVYSLAT